MWCGCICEGCICEGSNNERVVCLGDCHMTRCTACILCEPRQPAHPCSLLAKRGMDVSGGWVSEGFRFKGHACKWRECMWEGCMCEGSDNERRGVLGQPFHATLHHPHFQTVCTKDVKPLASHANACAPHLLLLVAAGAPP